jgi:hypothetical protein
MSIGEKVGELAYLGKYDRGYFIKQKLYGVIHKKKMVQRSAGYSDLRLSEDDFKILLNGGKVESIYEELPSYRQVFKEKEVRLLEGTRTIQGYLGDSRESVGMDSRPIDISKH